MTAESGARESRWAVLGFMPLFAIVVALCVAAFLGATHMFGWLLGVGLLVAAMAFKVMPIIVIAAFVGATDVWGWHWSLALLFVTPGVIMVASPCAYRIYKRIQEFGS